MTQLVSYHSRLIVSDWNLGDITKLVPEADYIRFDRERLREDIRRNIIDNANRGYGKHLDLVFKEANLKPHEFKEVVKMFGEPDRKIFCYREPAGYMASVIRKFGENHIKLFQDIYVETLENYKIIAGEVFEYLPTLTNSDYLNLLKPLEFKKGLPKSFKFKGQTSIEVTQEMREAYENFQFELDNRFEKNLR